MPCFSRGVPAFPALAGAAMLAFCFVASPVLAQTEAGVAAKEAGNDQVIITQMPAAKSRIRRFLERILGRSQGKSLETTPRWCPFQRHSLRGSGGGLKRWVRR